MAAAGFTAVLGATSVINYALLHHNYLAITVGLATVGILAITIAKNAVTLREAKQKTSTHELEGCLLTLLTALDPGALSTPGRIRLAVHAPGETRETLEQITQYIGDRPKTGRVGRHFPANAGIIGKAFRESGQEQTAFVAQRVNDDYEAYINELVRDWNYTRPRAEKLNPAVRAWMAVSFPDPDTRDVGAVLYLDSTDRDFFTPDRQELVMRASRGIAVFIGRRYTV